jgi:iron complex outermembrane receptor protein
MIALAWDAAASSQTAPAQAGTADVGEEVVVTAQQRQQSLQDVPLAVRVIGACDIARAQSHSLEDYARRIPSFKAAEGGALGLSDLSIRRVGNIGGQALSVAIDDDQFGSTTSDQIGTCLDVYDIERIEVWRGPQGTLFGRNTIGGAVNIAFNRPDPR